MKNLNVTASSKEAETPAAASAVPDDGRLSLPTAQRTSRRLLRSWLIGVFVFGYGPAITYGQLAWLFNERQWGWTYLLYFTEVPLIGGFCVLYLPWKWY